MKSRYNCRPVFTSALTITVLFLCLFLPVRADAQYSFTRLRQYGGPENSYATACVAGTDGQVYGTFVRYLGQNAEYTGIAFRFGKDGAGFQILRDFSSLTGGVFQPVTLFQASNGKLYGFAAETQREEQSLLYRMNTDGTEFEVLRRLPEDLGSPGPLLGIDFSFESDDGWLYGFGLYEIFRCRLDGSQFTLLHTFGSIPNDGSGPLWPILGSDGRIYGTCSSGGRNNGGTIYGMERDGTAYQILHEFQIALFPNRGTWNPNWIMEDTNGMLVGFAVGNQADDPGTLFRLNKNGSGYSNILTFGAATQGATNVINPLVTGPDGFVYGQTSRGGRYNRGTTFRMHPNGSDFNILYHFGTTSPQDTGVLGRTFFERILVSHNGSIYGLNLSPTGPNPASIYSLTPPRLQFSAATTNGLLRLTATGTTNTQWRIEYRDSVSGTNSWQPLTNITFDAGSFILNQPLTSPSCFYRGVWVP